MTPTLPRCLMRLWAGIALSLMLGLNGILPAPAQGAQRLSMVICTGDGLVRVTLDAEHEPASHSHCPDCVLTLAIQVPEGAPAIAPLCAARVDSSVRCDIWTDRPAGHWAEARSPPMPV